jgi:hypothetical protein
MHRDIHAEVGTQQSSRDAPAKSQNGVVCCLYCKFVISGLQQRRNPSCLAGTRSAQKQVQLATPGTSACCRLKQLAATDLLRTRSNAVARWKLHGNISPSSNALPALQHVNHSLLRCSLADSATTNTTALKSSAISSECGELHCVLLHRCH